MDEAKLNYQHLSRELVRSFGNEYQEARKQMLLAYTRSQESQLAHDKLVVDHKMEGILVR